MNISSRNHLGVVTAFAVSLFFPKKECLAQETMDWTVSLPSVHTVNSSVNANDTVALDGRAGIPVFRLDSVAKEHLVYVPRACQHKMCPLLVYLPWGGQTAQDVVTWMQAPADKYDFIVLGTGYDYYFDTPEAKHDFDTALRQTLSKFPIDRNNMAIVGNCRSGLSSLELGVHNLDLFNRIAIISGGPDSTPFVDLPPQSQVKRSIEFFIDNEMTWTSFKQTEALEKRGYRVKVRDGWRDHTPHEMYFDALGHWLHESWTIPNLADRSAPVMVTDSVPALTVPALTQMTEFWTRFTKEPEAILSAARESYRREVIVPVGEKRVLMTMTDFPALAAKYPSIAADFNAAGLTAQQHEAYRVAIATALLDAEMLQDVDRLKEWRAGQSDSVAASTMVPGGIDILPNFTIAASSVQGANMAFIDAHPEEFNALQRTGMMITP